MGSAIEGTNRHIEPRAAQGRFKAWRRPPTRMACRATRANVKETGFQGTPRAGATLHPSMLANNPCFGHLGAANHRTPKCSWLCYGYAMVMLCLGSPWLLAWYRTARRPCSGSPLSSDQPTSGIRLFCRTDSTSGERATCRPSASARDGSETSLHPEPCGGVPRDARNAHAHVYARLRSSLASACWALHQPD